VIKGATAGKRYAATIQVSNDFLYGTNLRLERIAGQSAAG